MIANARTLARARSLGALGAEVLRFATRAAAAAVMCGVPASALVLTCLAMAGEAAGTYLLVWPCIWQLLLALAVLTFTGGLMREAWRRLVDRSRRDGFDGFDGDDEDEDEDEEEGRGARLLRQFSPPHSADARRADACPICLCDMPTEGGVIAPMCVDAAGHVALEVVPEPLEKCGACGVVVHRRCILEVAARALTRGCPACRKGASPL